MIFSTGYGQAAGVAAGAWAGSIGGLCLYFAVGSGLVWIASPCLLYYLYASIQPGMRAIGGGFRSRQSFKRYLESSTINPRDADSHYQLGLIYQDRRQFAHAAERFEKAIEIDPGSADAHYQLGRIARQTERFDAALAHLSKAARLDDRCSTSEVWRELGATYLLSDRPDDARKALSKYLERRPYDPEGQFWYGKTLLKLGSPDAARQAFTEAVEAARTMPCNRRHQVSTWGSQAAKELRRLGNSV
jgi:tetratricopeptide (TPR) repeat protein